MTNRHTTYWLGSHELLDAQRTAIKPTAKAYIEESVAEAVEQGAEYVVLNIEKLHGKLPVVFWKASKRHLWLGLIDMVREAIADTPLKLGFSPLGSLDGSGRIDKPYSRYMHGVVQTLSWYVDAVMLQVYLKYDTTAEQHRKRMVDTLEFARTAIEDDNDCLVLPVISNHYPPGTGIEGAVPRTPLAAEHIKWVEQAVGSDVPHVYWPHPHVDKALAEKAAELAEMKRKLAESEELEAVLAAHKFFDTTPES